MILIPSDLDLLRSAAQALYGPRWQRALAKDIGVSERTVHRWVAGESSIPWQALARTLTHLNYRLRELDSLAGQLVQRVYNHPDAIV